MGSEDGRSWSAWAAGKLVWTRVIDASVKDPIGYKPELRVGNKLLALILVKRKGGLILLAIQRRNGEPGPLSVNSGVNELELRRPNVAAGVSWGGNQIIDQW